MFESATVVNALSWLCQVTLAFLFFRSAYRKVKNFARVSAEFKGWGYPFPDLVTRFLTGVWIVTATTVLVPAWAAPAAAVLLAFMIVAFATLVYHREFRRLIEPTRPILLSSFVIWARGQGILDSIAQLAA